MTRKTVFITIASLIIVLMLTACSSEVNNTATADKQIYSEVSDLQLVLLNSILYKDSLIQLEGKSIEGHDELIDDKYKKNITGGDTLVDCLKGFTLVDIDYGDVTGFKAAAFIKVNNLIIVYCGTDHPTDFVDDLFAAAFDFSAQDGQAKAFAKDNVKKYKHHDVYTTGYSMGGRLCYLGTEDVIDNNLGDNLKKVRTFNALGVIETLDLTDGNLSNIHNLEVKLADKTCNYIVTGDTVSDENSENSIMSKVGYTHVGTNFKVPCTNELDNDVMKQHDLYSIIDYLLNNPEPGASINDRNKESAQEPTQKPSPSTNVSSTDSQMVNDQINPGDYVTFGSYEQDNDTTNGSEPIDWLVLDKKDDLALIISRYGLDAKAFHKECVEVTWESCDLRGWLNDTFYRDAFTVDEQDLIAETTIKDEYVPDTGHDIIDKVFLLSYSEAEQLFENDAARKCVPTEYAKAQGAASYGDDDTCEWWLRSIGKKEWDATLVLNNGGIHEYGDYVNSESYSVRPALWMQLGSSDQNMTESNEENTQSVSSTLKPDDIHINFERFTDGNIQVEGHNGAEYAKITATDSNGSVLWTYQTEMNAMGQAWSVEDIGIHNGMYYYYERALGIVTLDLYTGEVIWVANASSGNIGTQFDEDGNLYCIGFESPLYVISPDGTILHSINLGEKGYYDVGIKCIWGGGVFVESMITMAGPEALLYIDLKTEEITECQYINNQDERFSPTGNYRIYRTDYLWVYKEPRITAEKLGKINSGEIVAVNTSKHYSGWTNGFCEIEYQGGRAYALPSYLEYVDGGMIYANIETDVKVSDITVYGWPDENAEVLGIIENGTIWIVGYNKESDFVLVQCEFGMGYIREHFDLS